MAAVAHGWKKPGKAIPQSVGKEFHNADKRVGRWEHPMKKAKGGHVAGCDCSMCSGGSMADGGHWIKGAIKHPGALHRNLGVPAGEKIPAKKLAKAAKSGSPTVKREVALAKTLKGMHKANGGSVKCSTPFNY
jgi:hypothetical protein